MRSVRSVSVSGAQHDDEEAAEAAAAVFDMISACGPPWRRVVRDFSVGCEGGVTLAANNHGDGTRGTKRSVTSNKHIIFN